MKNTKNIDQYFKIDEQPAAEMEERRPSVRRVSFALEPQIVYSHAKDEHSKSESSSIGMSMEAPNKTSIEMTLDENAMDEELLQNETLPLCEEREGNFIMEDSEDTVEERRMSMCPVDREKTMEQTVPHINMHEMQTKKFNSATPSVLSSISESDPEKKESKRVLDDAKRRNSTGYGQRHEAALKNTAGEEAADIQKRERHREEAEEKLFMSDAHKKEEKMRERRGDNLMEDPEEFDENPYYNIDYSLEEGKDDILSDMLSEIVCAADNNTLVYDTVNVEEVLSKYETTKKEETKKIREILAETGIRFLDNLSLSSRRETLSKIRNKVEAKDVIYYKDFVQRRIEMQNRISSELSAEIEKTREETEITEREVDCTGLSAIDRNTLLSKLRQMKSDARKEGKSHWHKKRVTAEKEFLKETERLLSLYEKEKSELASKIEKMNGEIKRINLKELEEKEKSMKDALVAIGTLSENEIKRFIEEVDESKQREEELKRTLINITAEIEKIKEEELITSELIEKEKAEIQNIQEGLLTAEVQKDDLEQVKAAVQRMEVVLGVKIVEISHSRLLISICDITITVIYDGLSIVDVYAETGTKSLFKEFIALSVRAVLVSKNHIVETISVLARYIFEMVSVEKEVKKLGVSVPYEIHYTEQELSIQFMVRKGKTGQMGYVSAVFTSGVPRPVITSNIKGVKVSENRYGSITETVNQAREIAHIK